MILKKCPICENQVDKFHPSSHVIPRWMTENVFNDNHKSIQTMIDKSDIRKIQSTHKGEYICYDCEDMFQKDDQYASIVLGGRSKNDPEYLKILKESLTRNIEGRDITLSVWHNLNFKKLQKFILGVFLRYHVYRLKYENKSLFIDKHFKEIKGLYLNDTIIDDESFP